MAKTAGKPAALAKTSGKLARAPEKPEKAEKAGGKSAAKPAVKPGSVKPGSLSAPRPKSYGRIAIAEPPKPLTIEERTAQLEARLAKADPQFQDHYRENLDMSWIYHDSALEGVVYTFQELRTAIEFAPGMSSGGAGAAGAGGSGGAASAGGAEGGASGVTGATGSGSEGAPGASGTGGTGSGSMPPPPPVVSNAAVGGAGGMALDSSMQPACEEIRRHREALNFIRDYAPKKRLPINLDTLKKIYLILHPEEGDIKTVRYRKDIPQHRLYFHEYAPPDKITYKVRQIVDWVNDPETRRTRNPVRLAARAHYDLLRVFPFTTDSGKVARLFMNLLLLRAGYPPAIVHSTERQRYYEALKGSNAAMVQIVQEAIDNNLASIEKMLDTYENRGRVEPK